MWFDGLLFLYDNFCTPKQCSINSSITLTFSLIWPFVFSGCTNEILRELALCTSVICFSNCFVSHYNIQLWRHYIIPNLPAISTTFELTFFTLFAFLYAWLYINVYWCLVPRWIDLKAAFLSTVKFHLLKLVPPRYSYLTKKEIEDEMLKCLQNYSWDVFNWSSTYFP